jgi:hypothetical protein
MESMMSSESGIHKIKYHIAITLYGSENGFLTLMALDEG